LTDLVQVNEDIAVGTSVAAVTATDDDRGNDGVVTFTFNGGNDGNAFVIGSSSGEIQTLSALDYDTVPTSYTLIVLATDAGTSPRSG
jgi:hypothetical protein